MVRLLSGVKNPGMEPIGMISLLTVPGELLDAGQLEVVEVDEAEGGPVQGLHRLPDTATKPCSILALIFDGSAEHVAHI